MEKKKFFVQPQIASKIVELCHEHALPVNIIVGEIVNGMQRLTFEHEPIDYHIVAWLVKKGTSFYVTLPAEEIMDDND